jgi:hypothetical protein
MGIYLHTPTRLLNVALKNKNNFSFHLRRRIVEFVISESNVGNVFIISKVITETFITTFSKETTFISKPSVVSSLLAYLELFLLLSYLEQRHDLVAPLNNSTLIAINISVGNRFYLQCLRWLSIRKRLPYLNVPIMFRSSRFLYLK